MPNLQKHPPKNGTGKGAKKDLIPIHRQINGEKIRKTEPLSELLRAFSTWL